MRRTLITGITGFVGSHLAELCLRKGEKVYGLKRYHLSSMKNVAHIEDKIIWYDVDLMDPKAIKDVLAQINPDVIFHMAAQSFVSPSWGHPYLYMDANYKMTVNLFEACLANKINPLIHIPGSGEEYGDVPIEELPITPETTLRPVNPYAVSKIAQDLIGFVYFSSYGTKVIRTRAFNHEGPRRDKVFGIPWYAYQIARIEKGLQEPLMKVGHIDDRRNFTHIKDMVEAYWLAVQSCKPGELYIIGTDKEDHVFTFRQALEMLIAKSKVKNIKYEIDQQYVRPTQVPRLICDPKRFVQVTGWEPKISFDTILNDTLEYWRQQVAVEVKIRQH